MELFVRATSGASLEGWLGGGGGVELRGVEFAILGVGLSRLAVGVELVLVCVLPEGAAVDVAGAEAVGADIAFVVTSFT